MRRGTIPQASIAAALMFAGVPVQAASKLPPVSDALSVQAAYNYAACIVDTTPRGAAEALALDVGSEAYRKKLGTLIQGHADGRCMNASIMRTAGVLIAGGMAEKLLIHRTDATHFPMEANYDASKPPIKAHNEIELTAMCMVRADPAKSWAVFATEPTSHEELAAMQALGPTLQSCVPAGRKMELNRPGLRSMLALAAYHMTQPAAPAQGN